MWIPRLSPLIFKNSCDYLEYTNIRDKQDKIIWYIEVISFVFVILFICIGGFFVVF